MADSIIDEELMTIAWQIRELIRVHKRTHEKRGQWVQAVMQISWAMTTQKLVKYSPNQAKITFRTINQICNESKLFRMLNQKEQCSKQITRGNAASKVREREDDCSVIDGCSWEENDVRLKHTIMMKNQYLPRKTLHETENQSIVKDKHDPQCTQSSPFPGRAKMLSHTSHKTKLPYWKNKKSGTNPFGE